VANICASRTLVRYDRDVHDLDRELATPLYDVTFVVLDLETTGCAPATDRITEVGALKLRGGELLGRFETLVDPGVSVPPGISVLTGITNQMLGPAPSVGAVLPSLLEFVRDSVIVGHNIRFDCAFLDAALLEHDYTPLRNRRVDTIALARRLVRDDVDDLRLHTVARHFHTEHEPVHRAYADAAATAEVFHALLERAGTYAVSGLDDLLAFPKIRHHRTGGKLALTARLPREPGAYALRGRGGRVLYVGSAANLRVRVRDHFVDDGRKVPQMLHELVRVDHVACGSADDAELLARDLVAKYAPPFNASPRRRRRSRSRATAGSATTRKTVGVESSHDASATARCTAR
jgi:DNA polymerase-3 subunit epsilon